MADVTKDAKAWLRERVDADVDYAEGTNGRTPYAANDPNDPHRVAAGAAVLLWALDEAEKVDGLEDGDPYDLGYLAALETIITKMALAYGWTP